MILSVDTGLKNFGIAIFDSFGSIYYIETIQTKKTKDKHKRKSDDYSSRIAHISAQISKLIVKYRPKEIIGEMPSFGAQSSNAAVALTAGATIIVTIASIYNIPTTWISPNDLKKGFIGYTQATKKEIMEKCCKLYNWPIEYKNIYSKKTKELIRTDAIYRVRGKKLGSNYFEHIADAIAAYYTIIRNKRIN